MNAMSNFLDKAYESSNTFNPVKADDYIVGDIVYCGTCNSPKQTWVVTPPFMEQMLRERMEQGIAEYKLIDGKIHRRVGCECKCSLAEEQARQRQSKKEEIIREISVLHKFGFYDSALKKCTFKNDNGRNPELTRKAKLYCKDWEKFKKDNIGLTFHGGFGTGKTFFASCIANHLLLQGVSVILTNMSTIINYLTNNSVDKKEYMEKIKQCELLVIDDLGSERQTEYALEQVYNVIDSRYRSGKPIIVTTNIPLEEIKHPTPTGKAVVDAQISRIYSRINGMTVPIAVVGDDTREREAKTKLELAKELFSN